MLTIPGALIDDVVAHAREEDPNECCGVMAADGDAVVETYRIPNEVSSPFRYRMDPGAFLRADRDAESRGLRIAVFYHSHTHSPAYPSDTDVRLAIESGYTDALVSYMLVSLEDKSNPRVRLFTIAGSGDIVERRYEVA